MSTGRISEISGSELKKLVGKEDLFLLDVRETYEYNDYHIPGAYSIPLSQLRSRTREIPRHKRVVCICLAGIRSHQAAVILKRLGYRVLNLAGGMQDWTGPIVSGKS